MSDFKEQIFELAFGDNAINKGYTDEEVIEKIKHYSNTQLELLDACNIAYGYITQDGTDGELAVEVLKTVLQK